jgi:Gp5 N-terminal OB domain
MVRSTNQFIGFDNFVWFQGVVENRLDPLKLGRVQVRILGIHTENTSEIPTADLPWAYPIQPLTSSAMNGIGEAPLGPVEGTWVIGFFRDGENCQEPVIFGTVAGIPQSYPAAIQNTGFQDVRTDISSRPRKILSKKYPNDGNGAVLEEETPSPSSGQSYPRTSHPYGCVVGESDVNRLARNENIPDTIVTVKRSQRDTEIPIADGTTWDEPTTPFYSSYPYNKVFESESGHILEFDDTVGLERIHLYHRAGTFSEIYPDGIKVEKIVGNNYKIVLEEQYEHIQNRYNLTIDGPFNILVSNNANIVVTGDVNISAGGSLTSNVGGDYILNAAGNISFNSGAAVSINSSEALNLKGNSVALGAAEGITFNGASVTSNPAVSAALKSVTASSISSVPPVPPLPQSISSVSVNVDNTVTDRSYPKIIPVYSGVEQIFAPLEDNFATTPEVIAYQNSLIDSGLIDTPPTESQLSTATSTPVSESPVTVSVVTCSGFNYENRSYGRELDGIQMTPNYTLGQLYDHKNVLMPQKGLTINQILCNIKQCATNTIEILVAYYGKNNLHITSGFRNLGSPNSPTSVHPTGEALDIQFLSKYTSRSDKEKWHYEKAQEIISKQIVPAFDQMILECPGTYGPWIHLAYVSTSLGGPSGKQRKDVRTWFGGAYLSGLILRP